MSLWPKVREELNVIVNKHFDTPEYHQLFSVKLTPSGNKFGTFTIRITSRAGATAGARRP
jgi:hypothetical protein